jgi:hypothetical protein
MKYLEEENARMSEKLDNKKEKSKMLKNQN